MTSMNEHNRTVIEEFRSNGGHVGGPVEGRALLLLTTIGAKSGQKRTNPLMYHMDGDRWVVFASKGGSPAHPDWFHNVEANPSVTVEVGTETFEAQIEVFLGEERNRLYAQQVELYPQFSDYEQKTTREIPAVVLTRKG